MQKPERKRTSMTNPLSTPFSKTRFISPSATAFANIELRIKKKTCSNITFEEQVLWAIRKGLAKLDKTGNQGTSSRQYGSVLGTSDQLMHSRLDHGFHQHLRLKTAWDLPRSSQFTSQVHLIHGWILLHLRRYHRSQHPLMTYVIIRLNQREAALY